MTERRFTRSIQSLGYLLRHPYKSLVAVWQAQDNDKAHVDTLEDVLPQIEMSEIIGNQPIHLGFCSLLGNGSTVADYALLKSACEFCAQKHGDGYQADYLEIGTGRGESILNVMESDRVNSAYSVTLGTSLEDNASRRVNANFFLKRYPNEKFHQELANSMLFDFNTLNKRFDVVYVDGEKSYEATLNDTKKVEALLKDEHSIIVWRYKRDVAGPVSAETLSGIRAGIPKEKWKHLYEVKNTLCAIYVQGQFHSIQRSVEQSKEMPIPTSCFEVDIKQHML